jgi:hypothetical protein
MTTTLRSAALAFCALALGACGDPDTNDRRGYTKAPLENPGWTVDGEAATDMAELGDPIRIPSLDTASVDTSAATTNPATTTPQPAQSANPQPTATTP